ncbi:MAG: hypothetical protein QOI56_371 [Actinomycetota bacterium]|nr:hypothetical protein [Actinomycetota bacterium]
MLMATIVPQQGGRIARIRALPRLGCRHDPNAARIASRSSSTDRSHPYTASTASLMSAEIDRPVLAETASSARRSSTVSEICVRNMMFACIPRAERWSRR